MLYIHVEADLVWTHTHRQASVHSTVALRHHSTLPATATDQACVSCAASALFSEMTKHGGNRPRTRSILLAKVRHSYSQNNRGTMQV